MPQAPGRLTELFSTDDDAFDALGDNFVLSRGGVISPKPGHSPTAHEFDAIDYLILEWDYGYQPEAA